MSAPTLTHPLVLENPQPVPDGAGGQGTSWQALGTLWCCLEPRRGRLTGGVAGPLSLTSWRIITRAAPHGALARPRPGQRLRDGARSFTVLAVAEHDPAGLYLNVTAEEETAS